MDKRKKIKIISVCLCVCLLVGTILNQAGLLKLTKAESLWNGTFPAYNSTYTYGRDASNKVGSGTEASPYKIVEASDLAQLAVNVNGGAYAGKKVFFELCNDINLNANEWTPIGSLSNAFAGVFLGKSHTIKGMKITISGTKNTELGLFGFLNEGRVQDVNVKGSITLGDGVNITGTNIGGIAGGIYNSMLTNCSYSGVVAGNSKVGGIAGSCEHNSVVNYCKTSNVTTVTSFSQLVGGIAGYVKDNVTIINSSNHAKVTLDSLKTIEEAVASGIAGYSADSSMIVNCLNAGNVSSTNISGGITCGATSQYIEIKNCYSRGMITATTASKAGAIAGSANSMSTIENCYYIVTTGSALEEVPGGFGGSLSNIGTFTSESSQLQKLASVGNWTMSGKTLADALQSYVSTGVATFSSIQEWGTDLDFENNGYPVISDTVGHIHDRNGGTTIKKEATCTESGTVIYKCSKCSHTELGTIEPLDHDYKWQTTDSTCVASGNAVQVCSRCDKHGASNVIPPKGHMFADYQKDATCTENGYKVQKCSRANCGYEDEMTRVVLMALGHNETKTVSDASCTVGEIWTFECKTCGNVRRESGPQAALGHSWDDVNGLHRAATCLEVGGFIRTCQRCKYDEFVGATESIVAHKWVTGTAVEPTCTESGYTIYECSCCHKKMNDNFVLSEGHKYRTQVVEPTCQSNGYTRHQCINCSHYYDDAITSTTQHTYEVVSVVAPSCTSDGLRVYKCTTCGKELKEVITSNITHNFEYNAAKSKKQTCTVGGYDVYTCTICHEDKIENVTTTGFGHSYVEEVIKPTCTTKGYTLHTCTTCKEFYRSDEVEKLGHHYVATVVKPTTTTRGYTQHKCSRCEDSYEDTYIAANPAASYDAVKENLILSDMDEKMMNSLDSGKNWNTTETAVVSMAAADIDLKKGIWVMRPGNPVTPVSDSSIQVIMIQKQVKPTSLDAIEPSSKGGTGSISGVNETMEYISEGAVIWQPISGSSIENLKPGTYYVRIRAYGDRLASDSIKIVIAEYTPPTPTPKPTATPKPTTKPTDTPKPSGGDNTENPTTQKPSGTNPPGTTKGPNLTDSPNSSPAPTSGTFGPNSNQPANYGNNNTPTNGVYGPTATGSSPSDVLKTDVYYTSGTTGGTAAASTKTGSKTAKTGDESNIVLWILVSAAAVMTAGYAIRRRREE